MNPHTFKLLVKILLPEIYETINYTAQKMKFSIKDFFSKYDQIRS